MTFEKLLSEAGYAGEARRGEPMSRHTSLGIGGPAELMLFPETVEGLARLMGSAAREGVPAFILGNGTNLLVLDGGIRGLVINLSKMDWIIRENETVRAGAGTPLPKLAAFCADGGLSGLEFAAGIPGTVGGAVCMNAGAYGHEIKDVLSRITAVDGEGGLSEVGAEGLEKGYRQGGIPKGSAVAEAWFRLRPGDREEIMGRAEEYMAKRRSAQPFASRSAGSTFRNPPGMKAWKLIEEAGMKGTRVGGAAVSGKHANFLINAGGATAKDFMALMGIVIEAVREKSGITLEPEVKIVGVEPSPPAPLP